jgi:hypothetical protein
MNEVYEYILNIGGYDELSMYIGCWSKRCIWIVREENLWTADI